MILKEAYRYQNYLSMLISKAEDWLRDSEFVSQTVKEHRRSKANPDANDETETVLPAKTLPDCSPDSMIDLLVKFVEEKEALSDAISVAKRNAEIDQDNAVAVNKQKQDVMATLRRLVKIQNTKTKTSGHDYKFDINGEQKTYIYDIEQRTSIKFDRTRVRKLLQKYTKETDAVSAKLDELLITTQVDYEPVWDITDTLEDIIACETPPFSEF